MKRLRRVGARGSIVIEKAIREQLGIRPGWEVLQIARDRHLEVHFFPPSTSGMSAGILRHELHPEKFLTEDALREAVELAMTEAAFEKESIWERQG